MLSSRLVWWHAMLGVRASCALIRANAMARLLMS
jgi:hypothetical protein